MKVFKFQSTCHIFFLSRCPRRNSLLRRRETPHQAKNLHSSTSWIKYYLITRIHNKKLSSIRQQLLRHYRVKTKVEILRSSRRVAAATTTVVVEAVLLKYFRSMYCQVYCSCFFRINCKCFFFPQAEFKIEKLKCRWCQQNLSLGRKRESENRIFYWATKQCLNDKTIEDCF